MVERGSEDTRMTGLTITKFKRSAEQKRKRGERERAERADRRHVFRDIGPTVAEADYRPRIYGDPDQALTLIFARLGRDYGGPLPAARC